MAFSSVLLEKREIGGLTYETYSFNGASVATGTITADTTLKPVIAKILFAVPTSDTDNAVTPNISGINTCKLTFTTSATGTVTIVGVSR